MKADDLTKSYTTTEDEYGDLISEYDLGADGGGPTEFYQQFDAQHAANAMIDEAGSIAQQFKFQAFGIPAPNTDLPDGTVPGWVNLSPDNWVGMGIGDCP